MFNLSKLKIGQKANTGHLKTLIENQAYQIHDNLVYGDIMQWVGGNAIEAVEQLNYASEGTVIYGRQHYFGTVQFTKNNGEWYVTSIRCNVDELC